MNKFTFLKLLIFAESFIFLSMGHAEVNSENKKITDRIGLEPSSKIELRARYQTNEDGKKTYTGFQYRFIGDGYLQLSESGCARARGELATGPKFSSNWDDTGVDFGSTKTDSDLNLNLRRAYIDIGCTNDDVSWQAGAMPTYTPGVLGVKEDGWVDGTRFTFKLDNFFDLSKGTNSKIVITLGQVDQYDDPSVFERDRDELNYVQIATSSKLTDRVTAFTDYTNHDTNDYLRGGLQISVADLVAIADSVNLEELIANNNQQGLIGSANKKVGQWDVKAAVSSVKKDHFHENTINLPKEDFYGEGENVEFFATRRLDKKGLLTLHGRCRAGDAGKRCEIRFATKL